MPKFAANISLLFTEVPFLARIGQAARAGFKGIEFLFPYEYQPEEIARLLQEHKMKSVLFNIPPGDWAAGDRGIAALPGREEEFRKGVHIAIKYALALGTPRIHAMAGLVPSDTDKTTCLDTFIENLKYATRCCAKHDIEVLIEPINTRDMPSYFLTSQDQAHCIRERVDATNLKIQMDFYHSQIMEGDISMTFKKFQTHIGHVQIAGVPDRHEPDKGEVNYPYLFELLDQLDYQGWVGCEYRPAQGTLEGLSWLTKFNGNSA